MGFGVGWVRGVRGVSVSWDVLILIETFRRDAYRDDSRRHGVWGWVFWGVGAGAFVVGPDWVGGVARSTALSG